MKINPGSKKAIKLGCTCAVLDNNYGWGSDFGKGVFFITKGCPVHYKEVYFKNGELND